MKDIKRVAEIREGRNWRQTFVETDAAKVYEDLAHELVQKKLLGATYIKSIRECNNYDGTRNITVTYDNDCRSIYTVRA